MDTTIQSTGAENILAVVERMRLAMKSVSESQESSISRSVEIGKVYECEICKDDLFIIDKEANVATPCSCREMRVNKEILKNCGISEEFRRRTLDSYEVWNREAQSLKNMAQAYVQAVRSGEKHSIAFLGQSGSGKSHLTFAIANELMAMNIPVRYMSYVDEIKELKALNRKDKQDDEFRDRMNRYITTRVLLIDDLFKGSADNYGRVNSVDVRYMFNIINERNLRGLPIIFSSEYMPEDLIKIDEALGGRIREICGKFSYAVEKDRKYNFRLRK